MLVREKRKRDRSVYKGGIEGSFEQSPANGINEDWRTQSLQRLNNMNFDTGKGFDQDVNDTDSEEEYDDEDPWGENSEEDKSSSGSSDGDIVEEKKRVPVYN